MPTESLPEAQQRTLDALTQRLQTEFGPRLNAVVLYGSAAAGEWDAVGSDLNLLIVLDHVLPKDLAAVAAAATAPGLSPVVLAAGDLPALARTAPATLWDARERSRLLAGADLLAALEFDRDALRAQLAFELRDKLQRLRGEYLRWHAKPKALEQLQLAAFGSLLHLLRGGLRLATDRDGRYGAGILGEASRKVGLELRLLQSFYRWRTGEAVPEPTRLVQLFGGLLSMYEQTARWLDELPSAVEEPATEPVVEEAAAQPQPELEAVVEPEAAPADEPTPEPEPEPAADTAPAASAPAASAPADAAPAEPAPVEDGLPEILRELAQTIAPAPSAEPPALEPAGEGGAS